MRDLEAEDVLTSGEATDFFCVTRISTENRNQTRHSVRRFFRVIKKKPKLTDFTDRISKKAGSEIRNARREGGKGGRGQGCCGARWHTEEDA